MRKDITLGRQVTRDAQETTEETRSLAFAHRVLIATCIVAGVVLGLVFVWYAADLLMLVFAGILVSILLRGFSQFLTRNTGLGYGLSLALISLMLLALIAAGVWLIGDSVGSQISEIQQQLPRAVENLRPATRSSRAACNLLAPLAVKLDHPWGLDHGTWAVLRHVYPDADIPVVQLSIDETQPAAWHFALGKKLAPLRDERILIMGSGNLVHNLHAYAWGRHRPEPYEWAVRFETQAKAMMLAGQYQTLVEYEKLGQEAMLSIPTPDHYLPLLYVLATSRQSEVITFPVEGVDGGSVSMLTVQVGEVSEGNPA